MNKQIKGIGIDIVEIKRLNNLKSRVLSIKELEFYDSITDELRKATFLGGRFAAKEAIFKAVSKSNIPVNYKDIVILNDENGKPFVESHPFSNVEIMISISHTNEYAVAQAIIFHN